ncbi:Nucleotidyltransferase [Auriculariales sp. MPI-PUGE-AT-0066]|nr:Nucleotidyltransferase [Auriculariales sp. MPI-PUGE-AT-0066]
MAHSRPHIGLHPDSSDSSVLSPVKDGPLNGITVHLIQQKLAAEEISKLLFELDQLGATFVTEPTSAEVVVTAITMRRRLERHLTRAAAQMRDVVTPQWVYECSRTGMRVSGQQFYAIREPGASSQSLRGVKRKLADRELKQPEDGPSTMYSSSPEPSTLESPTSPDAASSLIAPSGAKQLPRAASSTSPQSKSLAQSTTTPQLINAFDFERPLHNGMSPAVKNPAALPSKELQGKFDSMSTYAVQRLHPLVCPNQGIIVDLGIMRRQRELEGEARSALSYQRAIAAIKAQPRKLTLRSRLRDIPNVGAKICGMIEEYLERGAIAEAAEHRTTERFQALTALTTIHGIGLNKARSLYDSGVRTLDDCDRMYGITVPDGRGGWVRNENVADLDEDDGPQAESITREALSLRDELSQKIPRGEVEQIATAIGKELNEIEPGCVWEICGGYRRGKAESNDVDIVFTHPEARRIPGLCTRLVEKLKQAGLVTRSWSHLQTFHKPKPGQTPRLPGLDKSLLVFRMSEKHLARRVDLIFAKPEVFWTAVVGWTGSIMFERDLRLWAAKCGFKFNDSGILRLRDTKFIPVRSEREVFDVVGLEYIEPQWRNADL